MVILFASPLVSPTVSQSVSSVSHSVPSTVGHSVPSSVGHSVPPSVSHPVPSTFTVPIVSQVGGGHPLPYMSSIDELNKDVIVSNLSNPDESKVITLPSVKPKGGDIFVIRS